MIQKQLLSVIVIFWKVQEFKSVLHPLHVCCDMRASSTTLDPLSYVMFSVIMQHFHHDEYIRMLHITMIKILFFRRLQKLSEHCKNCVYNHLIVNCYLTQPYHFLSSPIHWLLWRQAFILINLDECLACISDLIFIGNQKYL